MAEETNDSKISVCFKGNPKQHFGIAIQNQICNNPDCINDHNPDDLILEIGDFIEKGGEVAFKKRHYITIRAENLKAMIEKALKEPDFTQIASYETNL